MSLHGALRTPIYSGGATSGEVPSKYPIALNGVGFFIDWNPAVAFRKADFSESSVPVLRAQADTSNMPGESSINPEGLWRRTQDTWHHGAGQVHLDRPESDSARFRTSKGVDCWTRWQLSLLPDTARARTSANTNVALVAVGSYLYMIDGVDLLRTQDIAPGAGTVWTAVTGGPGTTAKSVCTDGYTVYVAFAGGVYTTTRGAAAYTGTPYNALNADLLGYVKGRLMASAAQALYNVTAGGAAPAALFTHPNADFRWIGFTEGPAQIFAAGYSGDKSEIYRTAVKQDGTALDKPIICGELPDGEVVRAIQGYLGMLLIGSDKGVRLATINSSGDLTIGPLLVASSPVLCFEPQDRFAWYGLSRYDLTSGGLGRLDLSTFTETLVPAFASDLMCPSLADITGVVTFQSRRVFVASGSGVWAQTADLVPSGVLNTGRLSYGLVDPKVALFLDLRHNALAGTVSPALSADGAAAVPHGTSSVAGSTSPGEPFTLGQTRGEQFEVALTLNYAADHVTGPTVTRYTLRVNPAPSRTNTILLPLLLHSRIATDDGDVMVDVAARRAEIRALLDSQRVVPYQEFTDTKNVVVSDAAWYPIKPDSNLTGVNAGTDGTLLVALKEIA